MKPPRAESHVELVAADPEGDLACDFEIANEKAREGLHEILQRAIARPVRDIPGGVEVTFRTDAWDAVQRYVVLESRCCPFLNLALQRHDDVIILRVTGRPDALPVIRAIFEPA